MGSLYQGLVEGNEKQVMKLLNEILSRSISYYDNKESFYHGFLTGLFSGYQVESNRESGDGRFDLCIFPESDDTVVLIECKHSCTDDDLIDDSEAGAKQIIEKKYLEEKRIKKYENAIGYGISFYKKRCYVTKASSKKEEY